MHPSVSSLPVKNLFYKLLAEMPSFNQTAGFFVRQYLWKECMNIDFYHGDIPLEGVAFETVTFS